MKNSRAAGLDRWQPTGRISRRKSDSLSNAIGISGFGNLQNFDFVGQRACTSTRCDIGLSNVPARNPRNTPLPTCQCQTWDQGASATSVVISSVSVGVKRPLRGPAGTTSACDGWRASTSPEVNHWVVAPLIRRSLRYSPFRIAGARTNPFARSPVQPGRVGPGLLRSLLQHSLRRRCHLGRAEHRRHCELGPLPIHRECFTRHGRIVTRLTRRMHFCYYWRTSVKEVQCGRLAKILAG